MVHLQEDIQRYSCPVDKEMEKDSLGKYVLAVDYFKLEDQYNEMRKLLEDALVGLESNTEGNKDKFLEKIRSCLQNS